MKSHSDFNVRVVKEVEVTPQLTEDQDLCLTIGGDNTFLRAAGTIINSNKTAILGVNSQPKHQQGKLSDMKMDIEKHEEQIKMVVEYLQKVGTEDEAKYIEYKNRQRIHLKMMRYHGQCPITNKTFKQKSLSEQPLPDLPDPRDSCWAGVDSPENFLVLNEVMASEQDASQVSMYRLNVDNRDLGKFKSSGMLIATGTGSTGWLYSAKQITPHQVNHFKRAIGQTRDKTIDLVDYEIAKKINKKIIFSSSLDKMFYYVREGFQETAISEGFASDIVFTSEMLKGDVKIDG